MRFLVLGCNGMAGHTVTLYLHERGHRVTGFARTPSPFVDTVLGDAGDGPLLRRTLEKGEYDAVINCVGLLNQFAERDRPQAVLLNAWLPHFLAAVTAGTGTQVIHLSTDCVFSGKRGGYAEHDLRDGESFYDRSKALGELEDEKNVTLRTSIVGPDLKPEGIGLLNWFMRQPGPVEGYTRVFWTGQTTLQLAKTMEAAAGQRAHGLFHMVPDRSLSKYELLRLFNREIRAAPVEIVPRGDVAGDKSLVRTNFEGFDYTVPDYPDMVRELGEWMRAHRGLYPHYAL